MADRLDYFFRQRVTEAELDLGFELCERAERNLAADLGFVGVVAGAVVSQHAPVPDLTVDVSGPGAVYDQLGERVFFSSLQNVNVAQDDNGVSTAVAAGGNEKIVSVFVKFDRALSDPRVDGNSLTVFFRRDESFKFIVAQGAEAPAGTALPPPLRSDAILLADVVRTFGQTQVLNANIMTARRQDAFVVAGSPRSLRRGRTIEAVSDLLGLYNAHVGGSSDRHPASSVDYAGGGNWADGTTNPATTVEAQLDKLIADLAATSGAPKVGAAATAGAPNALVAGSVKSQINALLDFVNAHVNQASGAHAATAISYAGGGAWADGGTNPATTVEAQLDKIVADLAAATGAPKVGAAATAGAPNALVAGSVKSQLDALLGFINAHINQAAGAHAASAVPYAGGGNWKDGTTNPATTVEAQLDKIVSDLVADAGAARIGSAARTAWLGGRTNPTGVSVFAAIDKIITDLAETTAADDGAERVGAAATAGSPTSLAAGSVRSQLDALLTAVNARVLKAGDTMSGNLLPSATGLDLGSSGARWDGFFRDVNATASATGVPAVQGFAFDAATPAIVASGAGSGFLGLAESEALEASHTSFFGKVWDYVRGWTFLPAHAGDIPDAVELNGVTQRNIVKAWGSVTAAGVLNDPHWNIASVSRVAAGRYTVTLDENPGTRNAVVVTVNSGALSASFSVHVFSPDGVSFEVDINSGGALSDQAFMFVVLGA
jgi:hypothetical protein